MAQLSRRGVLRGAFNGMAVSVAIPLLDCFLNDNGTALAAGAPMPVRFGTWFWGLGMNEGRWTPATVGSNYEIGPELKAIEAHKDKVSILSGFDTLLGGRKVMPHFSGAAGIRTGVAPTSNMLPAPSIDVLIADHIGTRSRFRSIELSAMRDPTNSLSGRGAGSLNPAETSPINLYVRLFGPGFTDPNQAEFKPDAMVMARNSALSTLADQRKALEARVGVRDRERLDQYFTALRQIEQQLAIQLEKPAPLEACVVVGQPQDTTPANSEIEQVVANHKVMVRLLTLALLCDQTRVFNLAFNNPQPSLTKSGSTISHHQLTHEEPIDPELGYQHEVTWFVERCMEGFGDLVDTLASFKEGDATLLDHSLVLAHSETSFAKIHSVQGVPMMLAGRAGGRIKSGLHVAGGSTATSRVGLTIQQALGLQVQYWGVGGMRTDKLLSELLV